MPRHKSFFAQKGEFVMKKFLFLLVCFLFASATAFADWDDNDPYTKWVQMPDPQGWDVNATYPNVVADDWQCRESGKITDIHIWGSWLGDQIGQIVNIHVSIHDNIPQGPEGWSVPGPLLWERDFTSGHFSVRRYDEGEQGWIDRPGEYVERNHRFFHQINITGIDDPFLQEEGSIYWLDVSVTTLPGFFWGWKTSTEQFIDDAVWGQIDVLPDEWRELLDPSGQSLDMAFALTTVPIPGAVWLLGSGLVLLLGLRRRSGKK
jgi:hypothetical protein